jgi:arsenite methyltransferase
MISLARKNAVNKGLNPPHVAFVEALLTEALPIESNSVDCVLSNCVINLLPMEGKASLLKEVHRILKPGGRVVLDDVCYDSLLFLIKLNFLFKLCYLDRRQKTTS